MIKIIFFSKKNKTNKLINAQLREWNEDNGNIYSLLALTSSLIKNNEKLDNRLLSFADADSCVIILNPKVFIEKIVTEIKNLDVNCEYGMVKYYDPNSYHGELGIFL